MSKGFIAWILVIAVVVMLFALLSKPNPQYAPIPLSDFTSRLDADKVQWVQVHGDDLIGEFSSPERIGNEQVSKFRVVLPEGTTGEFMPWLLDHRHNARVEAVNNSNLLVNIIVPLVPWLLIFGFIWFFVLRQLRRQQNNKVGDALKVYVVNQPGEPPLASERETTPPPR